MCERSRKKDYQILKEGQDLICYVSPLAQKFQAEKLVELSEDEGG